MLNWNCEKGWALHSIFGLRKEWLDIYFNNRQGWHKTSILGNRQIQSLEVWLKTAGIEDNKRCLTILGEQFAAEGTDCLPLWELLWVNVVFNFPTARWYVHLGKGKWTTTELQLLLLATVPRLAERTISNAIMELVGLLERTPIGDKLGQGHVTSDRPRRIIRSGANPCDAALVYALGRLYLQQDRIRLPWDEDLTWPWVVFSCDRQFVLERLTIIDQPYLKIDEIGVTILMLDKEWWQCGNIMTILR